VLDNACGSGSFLLAAVAEGRRAIGMELNQDQLAFKKDSSCMMEVIKTRFIEMGRDVRIIRKTPHE